MSKSLLTRALGVIMLTAVLAACGGPGATTGPTTTPTGSAPASLAPTVSDVPLASASAGAVPSFDLGSLSGVIPGVDSYRSSFSSAGAVTYSTVVVTKPVLSKAITTFDSDGTVATRFVVVGDRVWSADGTDGQFKALPPEMSASMLLAYDPSLMLTAYAGIDWSAGGIGANQGVEQKNGVQATHLKLDSTTFAYLATGWPAGAAINIWVAQAGYVVAWEMTGFETGQDIAIEITNVNDPANVVETPAS